MARDPHQNPSDWIIKVTPNRGVRLGPKRRNVWCSTISSMWSVVTLAAGSRSKFATLLIRSRHAPAALGFGSVGSGTQQHGPRGSDQFDVGTDRIGVKCGQTAGAAGSRSTADSRQRYHHGGNLRKPDISLGAEHRVHASRWREITYPTRGGGRRRAVQKVLPPAVGRRLALSIMLVAPRSCYHD
jgi:hypothetical protein